MLEDIAKGESFLGSPLRIRTSTSQIWALHRPCKRLTIAPYNCLTLASELPSKLLVVWLKC